MSRAFRRVFHLFRTCSPPWATAMRGAIRTGTGPEAQGRSHSHRLKRSLKRVLVRYGSGKGKAAKGHTLSAFARPTARPREAKSAEAQPRRLKDMWRASESLCRSLCPLVAVVNGVRASNGRETEQWVDRSPAARKAHEASPTSCHQG